MAEEKKAELAKVDPKTGLPAVPDYLKIENDKSMDDLTQYIRPSRVKVVQSMTDSEVLSEFGLGTTILVPDKIVILDMPRDGKGQPQPDTAQPFLFTPLFFFTEFCVWNPLEMKGTLPAIRERSFDPNSKTARMSRDFSAREQPCPDDPSHKIIYCEHLNFIIQIHGQDEPCVLSFSRGEFKAGTNFAALLKLRNVPIYGNVFAANIAFRKGTKGNWYGLDISNPSGSESPFVGEAAFLRYKEAHLQFAEAHSSALIDVNYEDDVIDVGVKSEPAASM